MKVFDFNPGSSKPLMHLAHANGFLPPTYRKSLEPLFSHYHVVSVLSKPSWGGTHPEQLRHWSQLADDMVDELKTLTAPLTLPISRLTPTGKIPCVPLNTKGTRGEGFSGSAPSPLRGEGRGEGGGKVIGVGHSLGGVLTLYAAVKRPDLFSRVVLIDPTMLAPKLLWKIRIMKIFGFEARSFLIKGALRRRREWANFREAYEYFRGRQLFKNWSDEMVKTYTECITEPSDQGGVRLAYPPEWEARIYKTIPTDVWRFAKLLQQPALVLRGENSNTFLAESEKAFRKFNPKAVVRSVPGAGHLLPQEKPEEVGRLLLKFLSSDR